MIPKGLAVEIREGTWTLPPIFPYLQKTGDVPRDEMYRVFNMGVGFVMIVSPYYAESIQRRLEEDRVRTFQIGEVREGEPGAEFVD